MSCLVRAVKAPDEFAGLAACDGRSRNRYDIPNAVGQRWAQDLRSLHCPLPTGEPCLTDIYCRIIYTTDYSTTTVLGAGDRVVCQWPSWIKQAAGGCREGSGRWNTRSIGSGELCSTGRQRSCAADVGEYGAELEKEPYWPTERRQHEQQAICPPGSRRQ